MKKYYIYKKNTGEIRSIGITYDLSKIDYNADECLVKNPQNLPNAGQYHDIEDNLIKFRPALNIDNITLSVDEEYNPENIPAGTIVYVDGENVGVVDNTGLTLVFPVAKQYTVKLVPPFPYIEKSITVEVI